MLFNSIWFLLLFLVTYLIYWNVNVRHKKTVLIVSSLIFYGYFSFLFLFHFLFFIALNYFFSTLMWKQKSEGKNTGSTLKWIVILNFANLAIFKYFYFVMNSLYRMSGESFFLEVSQDVNIFLPLAISFYTFQLVALQVDIHRDLIPAPIGRRNYFLFILFFPQLIAGPIMRSTDFLPQLDNPKINRDSMFAGMFLVVGGLFKKVIIADTISGIIMPLYQNPMDYSSIDLFLGALGFVCQVYCDFSGYTDIARGCAKLLGYEIPENFGGPLLSNNFREFWGRWHITLSTWLRDYLYIPLGGSRQGALRGHWNMFVTMCLGGLWHGANITFIFWGGSLGLILGLERIVPQMLRIQLPVNGFVRFFQKVIVLVLFSSTAVFFRAASAGLQSLELSYNYLSHMYGFHWSGTFLHRQEELSTYILVALLFNAFQYYPAILRKFQPWEKYILPVASFGMLLLLGIFGDGGNEFIYFQF